MQFVNESVIEEVINRFEDEQSYLEALRIMLEAQPGIRDYLDQESLELLTKDEMALMIYLTTVIYSASTLACSAIRQIPTSMLEHSEDENWAVFNSSTQKSFSKILDQFFENYEQEDLLALVEDSIQQDEDNPVTSVGAEIIFIGCKSLIDVIHSSN
jgi:hypothetical protein